jgi:DNA-binding transcriptional MerR regulator
MTQKTYLSSDLEDILDISYRQLNLWSSSGIIPNQTDIGPGNRRKFTLSDIIIAWIAKQMFAIGFRSNIVRLVVKNPPSFPIPENNITYSIDNITFNLDCSDLHQRLTHISW